MPARMTWTAYRRGMINALLCSVVVFGSWALIATGAMR